MKLESARRQALQTAGLGALTPRLLKQAHGTQVHEALPAADTPEGDGWVCADRSLVPCVYVADCLALFIWDRSAQAVGVFHAGWRGLQLGMPRAAVRSFRRYGLTPEKLAAHVGPHIGGECYRVGPEVAEQFRPEARLKREDGLYLDLGEEARLQLLESGLAPDAISISTDCTSCMNDRYFSYRREKQDQRMMAFIALGTA